MKNIFNSVKLTRPKTNYFDLTHDVKMSGRMGELMPVLTMECVPGDKFTIGGDMMVRFAPMLAPIMHRVDATIHYFFVPNRILWDNWENFITGAYNTQGGPDPVWPHMTYDISVTAEFARLCDYMGLPAPPNASGQNLISALPFAAYNTIYAEYYRDQNLDPLNGTTPYPGTKLQDGLQSNTPYRLKNRAWEHDYFTAALPWAQKGDEVVIPYNQMDMEVAYENSQNTVLTGTPNNAALPGINPSNNPAIANNELFARPNDNDTAPSINDLRRAFKLQEWLEKNARGGTRYIESILEHFGVRSSDKRLQRPEYITGVKAPVIISEVLNTTGVVGAGIGGAPQGTMAGHGVSVTGGNSGSYYCEEHGFIIGIMSVIPKPAYQQGIPKMYLKDDALDYFWPTFAHLGEQPVQNQELYANHTDPFGTFGYVPRYAEYKYQTPRVSGQFRTTLDYWHLGRIFATEPVLNNDFVTVDPTETNRIFAVSDPNEDTLFIHINHKIGAKRPMPNFGTPSI